MRGKTTLPGGPILLGAAAAGLSLYLIGPWLLPGLGRLKIRLLFLALGSAALLGGSLLAARGCAAEEADARVRRTLWILFGLYLHLLLTVTLFAPDYGRTGVARILPLHQEALAHTLGRSLKPFPFDTIARYVAALFDGSIRLSSVVTNLVGNLLAFAPFGFFLPILLERMRRFGRFLAAVSLAILLVEFLQLFLQTGVCDIDDYLLNALGACLTFLALRTAPVQTLLIRWGLLRLRWPSPKKRTPDPPGKTP